MDYIGLFTICKKGFTVECQMSTDNTRWLNHSKESLYATISKKVATCIEKQIHLAFNKWRKMYANANANSNHTSPQTSVYISGRNTKNNYSIIVHVQCTPQTQVRDILFNQTLRHLKKPHSALLIHKNAYLEWCKFRKLEQCHIQKKEIPSEGICTICLQQMQKKPPTESFICLPDCPHVFCASCIRKWMTTRKTPDENACPNCRSEFVFL